MAGDFNKPVNTDAYATLLQFIRENIAELAKGLDASTAENIPSGAIRFNSTTKRWEKWNGSAWSELVAKASASYDIRTAQADDVVVGASTAKGLGQIGSSPLPVGTDANAYTVAGRFFIANAVALTNWPAAGVGGFLVVDVATGGTYLRQSFTNYNTAKIWIRVSSNAGASWSPWKDINDYVHNHTLDGLSNVLITGNTAGELLKWNGSAWVNNTLEEAGIPVNPVPAGSILFLANNRSAPTGFLKANGALVSRTTYSSLYAAIGTTFGAGDGATTFALPDLRGEFVRAFDDSRGVDSGREFGSSQSDEIRSHRHSYTDSIYLNEARVQSGASNDRYNRTENPAWSDYYGGAETRPRNIALLAVIKY